MNQLPEEVKAGSGGAGRGGRGAQAAVNADEFISFDELMTQSATVSLKTNFIETFDVRWKTQISMR